MAKYLDPKVDLTFKKVFGEHPNLVASLLNSLLPLPAVSRGEIPVIEGYTNKAADWERTLCLREITLARGLYRLGDIDGKGRRALESYASDPRKVYANYCASILCRRSSLVR